MKRYKTFLLPIICLIAALAIWEGCVHIFAVSTYVLPAPSDIAGAMATDAVALLEHSMVTLYEAVIGLAVATAAAMVIAILMDLSRGFRLSVFPYLVVSQTVPVLVLGPLFTMWLGFGMAPKILMVVFMCFFPIAISFSDAMAQVDKAQVDLMRSFGANKLKQYLFLKIPAAYAALFSGLKVSATYCIGGAIVGEWLSASAGLGYYMIRAKNGFQMDKVFACVIVIILWSLALNVVVTLLERVLFPYTKHKKRSRQV